LALGRRGSGGGCTPTTSTTIDVDPKTGRVTKACDPLVGELELPRPRERQRPFNGLPLDVRRSGDTIVALAWT
jgi:hypothetical protein